MGTTAVWQFGAKRFPRHGRGRNTPWRLVIRLCLPKRTQGRICCCQQRIQYHLTHLPLLGVMPAPRLRQRGMTPAGQQQHTTDHGQRKHGRQCQALFAPAATHEVTRSLFHGEACVRCKTERHAMAPWTKGLDVWQETPAGVALTPAPRTCKHRCTALTAFQSVTWEAFNQCIGWLSASVNVLPKPWA